MTAIIRVSTAEVMIELTRSCWYLELRMVHYFVILVRSNRCPSGVIKDKQKCWENLLVFTKGTNTNQEQIK